MSCPECQNLKDKVLKDLPQELRKVVRAAFIEAGMSGLCAEGQLELALDAINEHEIKNILQKKSSLICQKD